MAEGVKYCYANKSPQKARENFRLHDPDSPLCWDTSKKTMR